jgi:hypothetical protein
MRAKTGSANVLQKRKVWVCGVRIFAQKDSAGFEPYRLHATDFDQFRAVKGPCLFVAALAVQTEK